eukprot:TRINITY_DN2819_c0_g1_i2.p1 TRINITY_DN2819_c0_g1~~TRINITY_DN2819_c0_g1_i2.p1  ORF type:complete len:745 (-),score=132.85 TRINITY_DN2819_c0_g1_i2:783-3017(-)
MMKPTAVAVEKQAPPQQAADPQAELRAKVAAAVASNSASLAFMMKDVSSVDKFPAEMWELRSLTSLVVTNCRVTAVPQQLGALSSLTNLDLSNNAIFALPESLSELKCLEKLMLTGNALASVPAVVCSMTQLKYLTLAENQLNALDESFGSLKSLTRLSLATNKLTLLPRSFGELTALKNLNLSKNQLSNLDNSLGKLTALEILELGENNLATFTPCLYHLPALRELNLQRNLISTFANFPAPPCAARPAPAPAAPAPAPQSDSASSQPQPTLVLDTTLSSSSSACAGLRGSSSSSSHSHSKSPRLKSSSPHLSQSQSGTFTPAAAPCVTLAPVAPPMTRTPLPPVPEDELVKCENCNEMVVPRRFCPKCGTKMRPRKRVAGAPVSTKPAAVPPTSTAVAPFSAATPTETARRPSAGSESRHPSAGFSLVKPSTPASAPSSPAATFTPAPTATLSTSPPKAVMATTRAEKMAESSGKDMKGVQNLQRSASAGNPSSDASEADAYGDDYRVALNDAYSDSNLIAVGAPTIVVTTSVAASVPVATPRSDAAANTPVEPAYAAVTPQRELCVHTPWTNPPKATEKPSSVVDVVAATELAGAAHTNTLTTTAGTTCSPTSDKPATAASLAAIATASSPSGDKPATVAASATAESAATALTAENGSGTANILWKGLAKLDLSDNKLSYYPLPPIDSLDKLDLGGNLFTTFPEELMKYTKLPRLSVQRNALREIPLWITGLTALVLLDAG